MLAALYRDAGDDIASEPAYDPNAEVIETLAPRTVEIAGHLVTVRAWRTSQDTRVEVLSPGLVPVTQPRLFDLEGRAVERSPGALADGVAVFGPTRPGWPLEVELPTFVIDDADGTHVFSVAVGQALRRAGKSNPIWSGTGAFAIEARDVLEGDPALVLGGEVGSYYPRDWVKVRLRGNFGTLPAYGAVQLPPHAVDEHGRQLDLAGYDYNFTKDEAGNLGPGDTDVTVFWSPGDFEVLTIILGPPPQSTSLLSRVELTAE